MPSLRTLRRLAGLSQPQLARRSGVPQPTISLLEQGKTRDPRTTTLQRLKRAFGVTDAAIQAALTESLRNRRVRDYRHTRPRVAAAGQTATT